MESFQKHKRRAMMRGGLVRAYDEACAHVIDERDAMMAGTVNGNHHHHKPLSAVHHQRCHPLPGCGHCQQPKKKQAIAMVNLFANISLRNLW